VKEGEQEKEEGVSGRNPSQLLVRCTGILGCELEGTDLRGVPLAGRLDAV